ncbi:ABC transporter permease [Streptomyces sp. NPDC059851]|uniref:ABC transporter permease n=1 Tax=Streptomyces sp. NPDC059851 TaxID=3346971 RepID=UPI003653D3A0
MSTAHTTQTPHPTPTTHPTTPPWTWALADSWAMTKRELNHWARQPAHVIVGLIFPVMMLLMFTYLIGGGRDIEGDFTNYLVPGMLAMTMAFGLESTMLAVTQDLGKGIIDRFRSMPMNSGAVLVGRATADMLQSTVALTIMITVGYAIGWRWHTTPTNFLTAIALLLLLRFAMLWVGIHLAMIARKPELVQTVQILVWPLSFLSNAIATPTTMPTWLATLTEYNPLSATATTIRTLLGNPTTTNPTWATTHAELLAIAWPTTLTALFLPLAIKQFKNLNH